jgi:hypothetical protein
LKPSWLFRHYRAIPWGYVSLMSVITSYEIWHPSTTGVGRFLYWLNVPIIGICSYYLGRNTASIDRLQQEISNIKKETEELQAMAKYKFRLHTREN